ncbi:MAG: hybrid sensor histidine kinase/response regulator, partial [Microcoleus sp.]
VPILQGEQLWGLLIAHQCSAPRQWQQSEIDLLRQLATQVGIAIQQSELYEQTRRELSERQRMQAFLEASEERFRTLSAAAPIGICQTNVAGSCLYTNDRWQEMSGLSFEDCLGDGWLQAIHPKDRSTFFAAWDTYLQGASERLPDFRIVTPQGEIRWVSARVAPIESATGEIAGYVRIDEDITDRKLAAQKITQQAALIDIATDAILVRDLDNRILFWSQGAERLYGWTAAEVLGEIAQELFEREFSFQLNEGLNIAIEKGFWQDELEQVTKTGQKIIVASRWTLVRDEFGQPKSILAVNSDITEKKQLEAQFYRAQRLESIGTLASGIAHDFNNLLTPMLAVAQLLPLKIPNLDEQTRRLLLMLENSAKRGANLVQQVLSFSRGTEGKRVILQVGHLLLEAVNLAQRTFPKSIEISTDISTRELWTISADATQIHQVLMNLLVNARDAMPNGGNLTIAIENRYLDENYARMNLEACVGSYVAIVVSDTGTGIPSDAIERIFDPFFTTKEVGRGTGLGLATVLGIVKNHGGFIRVSSELGKGTQFQVFLPAAEGTPSQLTPEEERLRGNGELILIADDEETIREIIKTSLENCNYRTILASDGIEAIALYAEHKQEISVVLIDLMMPNLDGWTAIRTLQTINPQIDVIATSGLPVNGSLALPEEVKAFLPKPYTLDELLSALHDLISTGEAQV